MRNFRRIWTRPQKTVQQTQGKSKMQPKKLSRSHSLDTATPRTTNEKPIKHAANQQRLEQNTRVNPFPFLSSLASFTLFLTPSFNPLPLFLPSYFPAIIFSPAPAPRNCWRLNGQESESWTNGGRARCLCWSPLRFQGSCIAFVRWQSQVTH